MAKKSKLDQLRDSERLLEAELKRLRTRIAVAEKGQNKRIKDATKYIAKTNREIARVNKLNNTIQEQQLERLEKILGEGFETLAEARSAFNKQTAKPTKRELLSYRVTERAKEQRLAAEAKNEKARKRHEQRANKFDREITGVKLDVNKPKYTLRQLSAKENEAVINFLTDKNTFNSMGVGYLKPGEHIAISVPYKYKGQDGRTHSAYAMGHKLINSWEALQLYLMRYVTDGSTDEWLGSIQVIKTPISSYEYGIQKGREIDVNTKRRKDTASFFAKRDRARTKEKVSKAKEKERSKAVRREEKLKAKIKTLKGRK